MNSIGIISTVKTSSLELQLFVNYHLNIGIDEIILFFDDPEDKGINIFAEYSQVHTVKCSDLYWKERGEDKPATIEKRQTINVNHGAKFLSSKDIYWLTHIDSDELIHPVRPIKQVLNSYVTDAVRFSIREAISEREKYEHIFLPTVFKKKANNIQKRIVKLLRCSNLIFEDEFFRGHSSSKMAVKISPKIKKYGIHGPHYQSDIDIKNTNLIQLLHYDCVGIEDWKRKWDSRLDGSARASHLSNKRKKQLLLYKKAKEEGEEQLTVLYRRLHTIGKRERSILYLLRMLTPIKLDKRLFEKLPDNTLVDV